MPVGRGEQTSGIEAGLMEMFEDYVHSAELEVFGPVGMWEDAAYV
jgi:hypothetical protein